MISTVVAQLCPSRSLPTCFLPNRGRSLRSVQLRLPALSTDAALLPTVLDVHGHGKTLTRELSLWTRHVGPGSRGVRPVEGSATLKGTHLKLLSWLFFLWGVGMGVFWTAVVPETTRTLRCLPCVNIPAWSCGVESCYASEILSFKLLVNNRDVVRSLDFFFSLFFFFGALL